MNSSVKSNNCNNSCVNCANQPLQPRSTRPHGPLVAFGFLLLPPLTAYLFARSMHQLILGALVLGAVCAFAGFCLSYRFDLPAGPAEVALLGVVHWIAVVIKRIAGWFRAR
jgi:ABC-type Mn2+/Zn2+ transport system permease subunit